MVEAARLCAAADPDEVLLSDTARKLVGSRGGYEFTAVGSLPLKGLAHPLPAYALGPKARRRRTRTRAKWVAAFVVIVLVAGGAVVVAVSGDGEDRSSVATVAKPSYEVRLTQRDCLPEESAGDSTVTCQTLAVPENRDRPHGRTVKLPVVHAPAIDPRAIAIPTVSIGLIASQPDDALRSASPLIRLGGRGREPSTPQLSCTEFDTSRAERLAMPGNEALGRYNADLRACLERLRGSGIDLSQYDQADIADDVRDLAFALKQPRISLVATFTFARAALVVIRRYPGLLESVIMNDPNVPPTNAIGGVAGRFDGSLALLARRCADNTTCNTALPGGLVSAIDARRERLAANPQTVTVSTPSGPTPVRVDDRMFMVTLTIALGAGPGAAAVIPSVVTSDDATPIAAYFVGGFAVFEADSARFLIEACAEAAGQVTKSILEAETSALPRWRALLNTEFLDLCDEFDLRHVADLTTEPASGVPVFVIRGELTTSGTRVDFSAFAAGLTNFRLLELPNESAIPGSAPRCAQTLSAAFLRNPAARLDTKACAAEDPPIRFAIS